MQGENTNQVSQILNLRAKTKALIRDYFLQHQVIEVDTPLLAKYSVTDPYMSQLEANNLQGKSHGFLQTSPEYSMKKLLCHGAGDIYQFDKAFRADESGEHHRTEFTMLEWYRIGWDDQQLMDEVHRIIQLCVGSIERIDISYRDAFIRYLAIDPFTIDERELAEFATKLLGELPGNMLFDNYLTLLFSTKVESQFEANKVTFVYDFPASQAALAKIVETEYGLIGKRFEAYAGGLELANGFDELTEPDTQLKRFQEENDTRRQLGYPQVEIDRQLIRAMERGLPACAGVALGFDRLLMLKWGVNDISRVLPLENLP
ncbi:EF-P lysine aminoacylase EpmA [Aliikangiella marina]|uniref:EF-P lysine aminoacylase EpmA n=1 Tax=Aliikangiella marina TaxID=1712262 RepID=UPI00163DB5B4|nr:EF-P lysine aminoacylase EpmA [Aliikangiella marina]